MTCEKSVNMLSNTEIEFSKAIVTYLIKCSEFSDAVDDSLLHAVWEYIKIQGNSMGQ